MTASESSLGRDNITTSSLLTSNDNESVLTEFARSVAYTGLQSPAKALSQPIDRTFGTNVEESLSYIDAPREREFNTTRYWVQQTGNAVGMLGTFLVASKMAKGVARWNMTEAQLAEHLTQRGALGLTLKESALAGFIHDSTFRPTAANDQRSLLEARLASGATGALVMTTLTASTIGLKSLGKNAGLEQAALAQRGSALAKVPEGLRTNLLSPLLRNDVFAGSASGIFAGALAVNTESLLHHGQLASFNDTTKSAYTMSILGGAFGAWHQYKGQHESGRSNFKWSDRPSPGRQFDVIGGEKTLNSALAQVDAGNPVRIGVRENLGPASGLKGAFGGRIYGPEQALLVMHKTAGNQLDASLVRTSDMVASCNLEPTLRFRAAVSGDTIFLRAGKDRISLTENIPQTRAGERAPRALGELDLSTAPAELQDGLKYMAKKPAFGPVLDQMAAMGLDKLPNDVKMAVKIAQHLEPGDFELVLSQFKPKAEPTAPKDKPAVEKIDPQTLRQELVDAMEDASGKWVGYGHSPETAQRVVDVAHQIMRERLPGVHAEEVFVGSEQFAIVLSDNTVLKIQTHDTWLPEWGKRPYDVPLRKLRGAETITVGPKGDQWIVYRQPFADILPDTALVERFEDLLRESGSQFSDGGPIEASLSQLGLYRGKARLFDYPAVN